MTELITGVLLAGGRASRMGGIDKGLVMWRGQPLYQHVLQRFSPQTCNMLINANRNIERYQLSGYPVIPDTLAGYPGPLAGMLAGLNAAAQDWVAFAPCDTPLLPLDFVSQLYNQKGTALAAYLTDGEHAHPTLALLHRSLHTELAAFLQQGGHKLQHFMQRISASAVVYQGEPQALTNFNTAEALQEYENGPEVC